MKLKKCKECKCELKLRKKNPGKYLETNYCSRQCFSSRKRRVNESKYYKNPEKCKFCNTIIPYDGFQTRKANQKSKNKSIDFNFFCSPTCSSRFNNQWDVDDKPLKKCSQCKELFKPSGALGKKSKQNHCSKKCRGIYDSKKFINEWKCGKRNAMDCEGRLKRWIRKYLIEKAGNKCQQCGWCVANEYSGFVYLEVDHVDGDFENNTEENLRVLCRNCHSLTPTFMHLNSGNGRYRRLNS